MTDAPDKCPKCGETGRSLTSWDCGTMFDLSNEGQLCILRQLAQAQAERQAEIDEFNAGFDAAKAGVSYDDEPPTIKYDQWHIGWVWFHADALRKAQAELAAARERVKVLEGIVAKLPKTADGVVVLPGHKIPSESIVYDFGPAGVGIVEVEVVWQYTDREVYETTLRHIGRCYSTRAAAESASAPPAEKEKA